MKKLLFIFALLLAVVAFSSCEKDDALENTPIIYQNENYGFSLTFPETWKNYTTKEENTTLGKTIYFGFAEQETGLFAVSAMTKAKWAEVNSEDGPKPAYLGENENYVFGWGPAQHAANDEMLERMNEIVLLIQTFKVIN